MSKYQEGYRHVRQELENGTPLITIEDHLKGFENTAYAVGGESAYRDWVAEGRSVAIAPGVPAPGSVWLHKSGEQYTVIDVTDQADPGKENKFPRTVFYRGPDGRKWPRKLSEWHASFTFLHNCKD